MNIHLKEQSYTSHTTVTQLLILSMLIASLYFSFLS